MKFKKNIFLVATIILIAACIIVYISSNMKEQEKELAQKNNIVLSNTNTEIHNTDKDIVLDFSMESDYTMPESLNNSSSYIIIGKIKSIDGGINYNKEKDIYTLPQTIGTIEISKVIKGEISENNIPFIRVGGIVTFEEYEKSLVENQKIKLELSRTLSAEEKKEKYVSAYESEDIKPEVGKEYLMYLCFDEDYNRYNIQYFNCGLREIEKNSKNSISTMSTQEVNVKNNNTGKYEKLSDVLNDLDYNEK